MALNPSGGPSMNCTTCTALVTVNNSADTATYNAEYYSLGQVSKFVKPGAVRIGSNTFGSGNIEDVAFQNPDGSDALVVLNSNTSSANTFGVDENGQYFNYTLPAGAVATFTWTPGSTSTAAAGSTRAAGTRSSTATAATAWTTPAAAPPTAPPFSSGRAAAATPTRSGSSSPPAAATTRSPPATTPARCGT